MLAPTEGHGPSSISVDHTTTGRSPNQHFVHLTASNYRPLLRLHLHVDPERREHETAGLATLSCGPACRSGQLSAPPPVLSRGRCLFTGWDRLLFRLAVQCEGGGPFPSPCNPRPPPCITPSSALVSPTLPTFPIQYPMLEA